MPRQTILDIQKKKKQKIVAITAYDATFASLVDPYVDCVLVGDSLGMVIQGYSDTLNVTMDDMVYHTRAVAKKIVHAHLVADMPFLSYLNEEEAITNAGRLLRAGAQAVKMEGGEVICPLVKQMTQLGIPVMGHIGLMPQTVHQMGGFLMQGRDPGRRDQLLCESKRLEEAGAYAIVLESMPADLARCISESLTIPTIGIGAGASCDGQILVIYDLLGMNASFRPKFLRRYANLSETISLAVKNYAQDVRECSFPSEKESFL